MSALPGTRPSGAILIRRFLVVAVLIALDLWSKAGVFQWLGEYSAEMVRDTCGHMRMHVLGEDVKWFTFMLSLNPGAAFGKFSGFPHALVGLRIVAVIALTVMIIRAKVGTPWFNAALVLVLAGALGNLYDNLFMDVPDDDHPYGKVRDFIDVYFSNWNYHFPTFNVADSCISVGAVILLLGSFKKDPESPSAGEESDSEAPVESPTEQAR
jgi:signal peptidase II